MQSVSVCICAYNEANNIEKAIRSLYQQQIENFVLQKAYVVSSASTDDTDKIVTALMQEYPTLELIVQEKREGKNSAINEALKRTSSDIVVLFNADNIFSNSSCLMALLAPFADPKVGIVGGHPVPTNDRATFVGFASHMIWEMHHHISLQAPKIGEIIAFRNLGIILPVGKQSDEDLMKMELEQRGYRSIYAADAVVLNRGPDTVRDFIKQRFRVNIGEKYMKKDFNFEIPTWNKKLMFNALLASMKTLGFHPCKVIFAISLEAYARLKAALHVSKQKDDLIIWDMVESTKKL